MRGWRFVYAADVTVPSELPQGIGAYKNQQARWAQGAMQTAVKVLPALLRGAWPWRVKLEAAAHLTSHLAAPLTLALSLLVFPAALVRFGQGWPLLLLVDLVLLVCAMGPVYWYCAETLRARGGGVWPAILFYLPVVVALGIGISLNNTRAALAGLAGRREAEFVRTPKQGAAPGVYQARGGPWSTATEIALAGYVAVAVGYALMNGIYPSVPFLMLFQCGFTVVAARTLTERVARPEVRLPSRG